MFWNQALPRLFRDYSCSAYCDDIAIGAGGRGIDFGTVKVDSVAKVVTFFRSCVAQALSVHTGPD